MDELVRNTNFEIKEYFTEVQE
jgi:hypothetical protein